MLFGLVDSLKKVLCVGLKITLTLGVPGIWNLEEGLELGNARDEIKKVRSGSYMQARGVEPSQTAE